MYLPAVLPRRKAFHFPPRNTRSAVKYADYQVFQLLYRIVL